MDTSAFARQLDRSGRAVSELVKGIGAEEAAWKPTPDRWSILEICCHLLDEEREDFRRRVDFTLHRPGEPWPPIDPVGWVTERRYAERDLDEVVRSFRRERENSIAWLMDLSSPDWEARYEHPKFGVFRAGDIMASWLAHDLLHIRQIARAHFDYLARLTPGYDTAYAGRW